MTHFESFPDGEVSRGLQAPSVAVSAPQASSPTPDRVATPRHTSQLVRLIQNARRRGTPIAICGRDAARARPSDLDSVLTVDLSSWQHVDVPNPERLSVTAEPGASFRQILAKTLPFGLV